MTGISKSVMAMSYPERLRHYESDKQEALRQLRRGTIDDIDGVLRTLRKKWKI